MALHLAADPSSYHPRTLMPNLILEPIDDGQGHISDPAEDIAAYLLSSKDWEPKDVPARELSDAERKALHELAFDPSEGRLSQATGHGVSEVGHPANRWPAKSRETTSSCWARPPATRWNTSNCCTWADGDQQVWLLGLPRYSRLRGREADGHGLADWGRKSADKLAFEQITQYILHGHGPKPVEKEVADVHDPAYQGPHKCRPRAMRWNWLTPRRVTM